VQRQQCLRLPHLKGADTRPNTFTVHSSWPPNPGGTTHVISAWGTVGTQVGQRNTTVLLLVARRGPPSWLTPAVLSRTVVK
jgi:hypothetical protein